MEIPINTTPPSSSPNSPPQSPPLHPCDQIEAPSTVSTLHQPINDEIGNQKQPVELRSIAKDFPNMMKFTSTPAMLDLCIMDSLMPSPRFMQKMTQVEDITTPPSSIQFEDEPLLQAGSPMLLKSPSHPKQDENEPPPKPTEIELPPKLTKPTADSTHPSPLGAWATPLKISDKLTSPGDPSSGFQKSNVDYCSVLSIDSQWPALSAEKQKLSRHESSRAELPETTKEKPTAFNAQEYPWAAKMRSKCNLHRVTTPVYMEDGTPKVCIPSHVLLEGLENQREYVIGQFYRCKAPPGGQIHAVAARIWGRKYRIFTKKLGESSYLFHIPDESTRNWVIQRGLWHVDDCLMFVSAWSPAETISLPEIATIPIWLTLKNIPYQLYSFKGIDWIASGIGEPMLTSKPWLDPTSMGEAKILVEVKLNKPFPQKVALEDKSGSITMVDVVYSWLPPKCETCGQLGHKATRCLGLPLFPSLPQVTEVVANAITAPVASPIQSTVITSSPNLDVDPSNSELTLTLLDSVNAIPMAAIAIKTDTKTSEVIVPVSATEIDSSSTTTYNSPSTSEIAPLAIALPKAAPIVTQTAAISPVAQATIEIESTMDLSTPLLSTDIPSKLMANDQHGNILPPSLNLDPPIHMADQTFVCMSEENEKDVVGEEGYAEASTQMSRGGRPIKPTQKMQEMQWTIVGGRKHRGRGRGGRGNFNS